MYATPSPQGTPNRRIKETLFSRYPNTVGPVMIANYRKITLQAIHPDAVVLDDRPNIPKFFGCVFMDSVVLSM